MMKRFLSLLLATMLLASVGGLAEEAWSHVDFAGDWQRFAKAENEIHMAVNWALGYADAYLADRTWDNLCKARHAAASARAYLTYLDLPETELPVEAYVAFAGQGHDLSVLSLEWQGLAQCRSDSLLILRNLGDSLDREVFWSYDMEHLETWVQCEKQYQTGVLQYYAILTDYLLTTADTPSQRAEGEAAFAAACPEMFADYRWVNDDPTLQWMCSDMLDTIRGISDEKTKYTGARTADTLLMAEAFESGDLSILLNNAETITGRPEMISDPGWLTLNDEGIDYTIADAETGEDVYTMPGTAIGNEEISCSAIFADVSRAEFDSYLAGMSASGMTFNSDVTDGEKRTVIFVNSDCSFAFSWTSGCVIYIADGHVLLAPSWYFLTGK